jgi:hypothetical protein
MEIRFPPMWVTSPQQTASLIAIAGSVGKGATPTKERFMEEAVQIDNRGDFALGPSKRRSRSWLIRVPSLPVPRAMAPRTMYGAAGNAMMEVLDGLMEGVFDEPSGALRRGQPSGL